MRDWTPLLQGVAWNGEPVFDLALPRSELVERFGEPQHVGLDSNGVGLFDAWTVRFSYGLEVALWCSDGAQGPPTDRPTFVSVRANSSDRRHVAFHVGFADAERERQSGSGAPQESDRWQVMRTDDNGNDFEMARVSSRCEAVEIAEAYEARGHKQFYWIEQAPRGRPR